MSLDNVNSYLDKYGCMCTSRQCLDIVKILSRPVFICLDNISAMPKHLRNSSSVVSGSIAFISHSDQNEVKHEFLHVMPLAPVLASDDAVALKMTSFYSLGGNN